ncbi:MAG: BlaI/MecI/CopY family transcriptional regulator [Oscillospiraceae bacterium]|nr:BlaI/MecI/CopY family transcriptional regulator [Oscillospiraceae bacterium]
MAIPKLPDAELEIMKIIWRCGGETTSAHIYRELEGKKEWAVTTVLNFLARLVERGFLNVRRIGKANIYAPIICEDEYLESASRSFLERLHGNSLKSLVASLYDGEAISRGDLEELRRYIEEKAGETL